ncbi:biotin/lipoyl-binding carrier protein [Paraburkholderia sp.]|uniref:biotin/lipoyl-binding carrier protein n=1 Tax=Paraburkholderia sp. TaxID=1926495 RepID=UPI003C7E0852
MQRYEARSEVTGSVWKITKVVDDKVMAGDTLMIFESMKMEIPLIAEESGTVVEIRVAEGSSVADGDIVVVIEY